MSPALTTEQLKQVVNNTVVVMLVRPDLVNEWYSNLFEMMRQAQRATLEDEAVFIAAVLSLLQSPNDTLPTGTIYDRAWESILVGLQTGVVQEQAGVESETVSLEQLLNSIVQAVVTVITQAPGQKETIVDEMVQIRAAAIESGVPDLADWLDDVIALLKDIGEPDLGQRHEGIYATYWKALMQNITRGD